MNAIQSSTASRPSSHPEVHGHPHGPHAGTRHGDGDARMSPPAGPHGGRGGGPHGDMTDLERTLSGPTTFERHAAGRTTHERLADRDDPRPGDAPVPAAVIGRAGASGREAFVTTQAGVAERVGRTAPQTHYEGQVLRNGAEEHGRTYTDSSFSDIGGRYNRVGEKALYTTETMAGMQAEASHYGGLDGRRITTSSFTTDRMLDVVDHPRITAGALSEPYGSQGGDRSTLSKVMGEDPYLHSRALSDGARDAGAEAMRVPANDVHVHVNVIPESTVDMPKQFVYEHHVVGGSNDAPRLRDETMPPASVNDPNGGRHVPDSDAYRKQLGVDEAGHGRAGGVRYGAAGAATVSTVRALSDGHLDAREVGTIGTDTALGAGSAWAADAAASRLGYLRGGALVDGLISVGTSTLADSEAVANGTMSAGDATADVAIDAGVAISSGMAGMAAGALAGSAVPVIGTAAGAVVGFVVGAGTAWAASKGIEASGVTDAAREKLGDALEANFERPLERAWGGVDRGLDAVKSAGGGALDRVKGWFGG